MELSKKRGGAGKHRVVIVGGGFAGIRCALDLAKNKSKDVKVTLISNKKHFEYYPRIYRVVTGESPLEVCIPLSEIFLNKDVEVVQDEVVNVDLTNKKVTAKDGSVYMYDDIVLGLGSETVYFNIEGVKERSFGFKSINEALALKTHLHKMFDVYLSSTKEDLVSHLHIVIVGGGPSGVELAGELTKYMAHLAHKHNIDNNFVTIDIVEASPRLVSALPEDVSLHIYNHLHSIGVNIFLNRTVVKEDVDEITMKDMSLKSNTLIWTAGSRTNHFYEFIKGLTLHRSGRVLVDDYLQADGFENVYIAGDSAFTKYAGLAQTALYDGTYIAKTILKKLSGEKIKKYVPSKVAYAVPAGKHWAAVSIGPIKIYGFFGWVIRELVDMRFFLTILPFYKAFRLFRHHALCESCTTCEENIK